MSKNKKARRMQEDEIPRSVLKMKQEKEKREREEARKNNINNKYGKRSKENQPSSDFKRSNKKISRKKLIKRIVLIIILIILITIGICLGVSAHTWKELATAMFNNENSIVVDTDGNTIAKLRF